MKDSLRGWIIVSLLSLLPVILWFSQPDALQRFADLSSILLIFGELTALIGVVAFSLSFVLSMRITWLEDFFGGMNRVYQAHHTLGGIAFILLLIHPLLLVYPYSSGAWSAAAAFFLPGSDWTINIGMAALLSMMALLIITYYLDFPYEVWRFTHKFLGAAFFLGAMHGLLVSSDVSHYRPLFVYITGITAIGMIAFIYRTLLGRVLVPRHAYIVSDVIDAEGNVTQLILNPEKSGAIMHFYPGQFVFLSMTDKVSQDRDPHPFSISSSPLQETIRLSIKALGDYSTWIRSATKGSKVFLEGPYGRFSSYFNPAKSYVWIGGGIGITPFISMAYTLTGVIPVDIYYCMTNPSEAAHLTELKDIEDSIGNVRIIPWYSAEKGRITAKHIEELSGSLVEKHIFICGPPAMMHALKKQLKELGVSGHHIYTEEFEMS